MSKHTPGPWAATYKHLGDAPFVVESGQPGEPNGGCYMAECYGPDAEANARLIAAAPELLEALELLLFAPPSGCVDHHAIDAKARAAIAKARGE